MEAAEAVASLGNVELEITWDALLSYMMILEKVGDTEVESTKLFEEVVGKSIHTLS